MQYNENKREQFAFLSLDLSSSNIGYTLFTNELLELNDLPAKATSINYLLSQVKEKVGDRTITFLLETPKVNFAGIYSFSKLKQLLGAFKYAIPLIFETNNYLMIELQASEWQSNFKKDFDLKKQWIQKPNHKQKKQIWVEVAQKYLDSMCFDCEESKVKLLCYQNENKQPTIKNDDIGDSLLQLAYLLDNPLKSFKITSNFLDEIDDLIKNGGDKTKIENIGYNPKPTAKKTTTKKPTDNPQDIDNYVDNTWRKGL